MKQSAASLSISEPTTTVGDFGDRVPALADLLRENAELKQQLAELQEFRTLAYKDPLTGLWNRRYFDERLSEEVDRTRRSQTRQLSLMVIDVNDLKTLNDAGGHAEGDRALRAVATFLRSHLRAHDVCCRAGGDEFAVILPDVGHEAAEILTARLRKTMAWETPDRALSVGLSVGYASLGAEILSPDGLLRAADRAMYRDKSHQKRRRHKTI
jgi:two-component system cell cycle response regulator